MSTVHIHLQKHYHLQDFSHSVDENVDIVVSWLVGSKDCRCPVTKLINDAVNKLINRYDFVIFDCEFDLKYLNQLVDTEIDSTIIVGNASEESAHLSKRIEEFSSKYSAGNQLGVVINKVDNENMAQVYELLKKYDLEVLGVIPFDKNLAQNPISRESKVVQDAIKEFYFRLNLPQAKQ